MVNSPDPLTLTESCSRRYCSGHGEHRWLFNNLFVRSEFTHLFIVYLTTLSVDQNIDIEW